MLPAAVALLMLAGLIVGARAKSFDADYRGLLQGGERFLERTSIYAGTGPLNGLAGPPFEALCLVPFALLSRLSAPTAALAWIALNLCALAAGVWGWSRAVGVTTWRAPGVWLSLLAVSFPLYREYQSQNVDLWLLCATGWAACALSQRREAVGGCLLGFAAALKLFPGLVILYLLARRMWKAAAIAAAATGILSVLPAAWYGIGGFTDQVAAWIATRAHGDWPRLGFNQSLTAGAVYVIAGAAGVWAAALVGAVGVTGLLWLAVRRRPRGRGTIAAELAGAFAVAVLVSPIAWINYFLLMFPLGVVLSDHRPVRGTPARTTLYAAGILMSGVAAINRSHPSAEQAVAGVMLAGMVGWLLVRADLSI